MVWRGPMVTQALTQLLNETDWGELDYLVIDLPPAPATSSSRSQRVPVSGAVVVTTPQDIALLDARKGLRMFQKVAVPVLGVVENMSTHVCSNCGHEEPIFGAGGGERMAQVRRAPARPAAARHRIRKETDEGRPTVVADPGSRIGRAIPIWRGAPPRNCPSPGPGQPEPHDHRRGHLTVSIKSDRWIRRMAETHGMIEPFERGQVRVVEGQKIVSYGTSSYGYDVRCAAEFKIFTNINSTIVDPKNFDTDCSSTSTVPSASSRRIPSRSRAPSSISGSRAAC